MNEEIERNAHIQYFFKLHAKSLRSRCNRKDITQYCYSIIIYCFTVLQFPVDM